MKGLFSRKELEQKAQKVSESSNVKVRVNKVNGKISVELADSNMENKKIFNGDIVECSLFVEGLMAFIQVGGKCEVKEEMRC